MNSFFKSIVAISRPFLSLAAIPDVQILIKRLRDMKGGEKRRKDRKKKKKSGSNGVPSLSLPEPSPPFHPPFAVFSYSIFSAPSVLSDSLSRLFKTHPTLPQAILFRMKCVLAQDHILPSDT